MSTTTTTIKPIRNDAQARAFLAEYRPHALAREVDGKIPVQHECPRCGGSGHYSYNPIDGTTCFQCKGRPELLRYTELVPVKEYAQDIARRERARLARQRKAEEKAAAQLERQRDWCEENGHGRITFAELDAKREAEREAKRAAQVHVGTVGERAEFTLELVHVTGFDTAYGYSELYIFADADGNSLVWRTGSGLDYLETREGDEEFGTTKYRRIERGDRIRVKATVKAHSEYKGAAQTALTRVKLIERV